MESDRQYKSTFTIAAWYNLLLSRSYFSIAETFTTSRICRHHIEPELCPTTSCFHHHHPFFDNSLLGQRGVQTSLPNFFHGSLVYIWGLSEQLSVGPTGVSVQLPLDLWILH